MSDSPLEIFCDTLNIMISEDGRRVWVCTESGTILRAKIKEHPMTLDDRRIIQE